MGRAGVTMATPGLQSVVGDDTGVGAKETAGSHGNKKNATLRCSLQPERFASSLTASVEVPSELRGHQRVT